MINLDFYQTNGTVTISLLLTQKCNFACRHCFYACGPTLPDDYMSRDVLYNVRQQVERLQELDIAVSVNFIGGEPTLDMEKFGDILHEVSTWDCELQMTTNGWWFHEVETARAFFETVSRYVDPDGQGVECDPGYISVRISNDEYHDQFRPSWLQNGKFKGELDNLWDYDERGILYETEWYCTGCSEVYEECPEDETCPECGEYCEMEYKDVTWNVPPRPDESDPWLYVDSRSDSGGIIPSGGRGTWGSNDVGSKGWCHPFELSYLPDGTLMDICCKGSWCEFGTVEDDPLLLLEVSRRFVEEIKPSCRECRMCAEDWKTERLEEVRTEVEKEIEQINEED